MFIFHVYYELLTSQQLIILSIIIRYAPDIVMLLDHNDIVGVTELLFTTTNRHLH